MQHSTYHTPRRKNRYPLVIAGALAFTAILFFVLPFFQILGKSKMLTTIEIWQAMSPPPAAPPVDSPPPPEPEPETDTPQLQEPPPRLSLTQLALALEPGTGGAMGDFSIEGFHMPIDTIEDIRIFELSELDRVPRALFQVAPVFPYEMRQAGVGGLVRVIFVVDENGNVRTPRIDSSSHREFEQPSLDAIAQWKFEPGMKDGKAVRTRMLLPIAFNVRR